MVKLTHVAASEMSVIMNANANANANKILNKKCVINVFEINACIIHQSRNSHGHKLAYSTATVYKNNNDGNDNNNNSTFATVFHNYIGCVVTKKEKNELNVNDIRE